MDDVVWSAIVWFSNEALQALFGEDGPVCRDIALKLDMFDEYDALKIIHVERVTPEMRKRAIELEAHKYFEYERKGVEVETDQERQDRHWLTAERNVDVLLEMLRRCKRGQ